LIFCFLELIQKWFFFISATNPFETPAASNPFAAQLSSQQPARITLNQMQNNTTGFSQSSTSGLLPAPLAPMSTTGPAQPQQQSCNPFL
jgi:hypothetical protein